MGGRDPRRAPGHGLGDPRLPWQVLLEVQTTALPPDDVLAVRLADTGLASATSPVLTADRRTLLGLLADTPATADPLGLGRSPEGMVLRADHRHLDGLAMLTVAGRLLGQPVASAARGVDGVRRAPRSGALLGRVAEAALRPPARVAAEGGGVGDAFARLRLDGVARTLDLVAAGIRAVTAWNAQRGGTTDHISVAVGVSAREPGDRTLTDRSGFLRLRDAERLGRAELSRLLATAPLQPGSGPAPTGRVLGTAAATALRTLAPRLGSTLLVSHLGTVTAPPAVTDLALYPVTGGGSGVALGAATVAGRTTLTLRARGDRFDDAGLARLLQAVAGVL